MAQFGGGTLIRKILIDNAPDEPDYKVLAVKGLGSVSFSSTIKRGLAAISHLDVLRVGTLNLNRKRAYSSDPADATIVLRAKGIQTKKDNYNNYTLPALRSLSKSLGCLSEPSINEGPNEGQPFTQQFDMLASKINGLNDVEQNAVLQSNAATPRVLKDQVFLWLTTYFAQHGELESRTTTFIVTAFSNLDQMVDHFLTANILDDEWFGHVVFDRAHCKALMAANDHGIRFGGDHKREYLMKDIIRAMCKRVDQQPGRYPNAEAQLRLRLHDVSLNLGQLGHGVTAQDVASYREVSLPQLWRSYLQHNGSRFAAGGGIFGRFNYKPLHKVVGHLRAKARDHEGASRDTVDEFRLGR